MAIFLVCMMDLTVVMQHIFFFFAGTLYETIGFYLHLLEWHVKQQEACNADILGVTHLPEQSPKGKDTREYISTNLIDVKDNEILGSTMQETSSESFSKGAANSLKLSTESFLEHCCSGPAWLA